MANWNWQQADALRSVAQQPESFAISHLPFAI